jgi:hypothetical protein
MLPQSKLPTNSSDEAELEERTALFLTLAGVAIQKDSPEAVSSRKLFKVLANSVWDWCLLPEASGNSLSVSDSGDLVWVPHRFGSLGLVQPSINYPNVRQSFGLFAHMSDLLRLGIYAKYGVRIVPAGSDRDGQRIAFEFPQFLSISQLLQSRVDEIDRHVWSELTQIYAGLDDRSLDTMASCRNSTTTTFSLWTQLVVWRDDLLLACGILQEVPERQRTPGESLALSSAVARAAAAASQFGRKVRYWQERDSVISDVRKAAVGTELNSLIPVTAFHRSTVDSDQLDALLNVRDIMSAGSTIFQGLFRQYGLAPGTPADPRSAEDALRVIRERTGAVEWGFRELATLWCGTEIKPVADYIETLLSVVITTVERETRLTIANTREHYRTFMQANYPLPRG